MTHSSKKILLPAAIAVFLAAFLALVPVFFNPRKSGVLVPSADRRGTEPPAEAIPPLGQILFFNDFFPRFSSRSLPGAFHYAGFRADLSSLRLLEGEKRVLESEGKSVLAVSGDKVAWVVWAERKVFNESACDRMELEVRTAVAGDLSFYAVPRPAGLAGRLRIAIKEGIKRKSPGGSLIHQTALVPKEKNVFQTIAVPLDFKGAADPEGILVRFIPGNGSRADLELRRLEIFNQSSALYEELPSAGYLKYGGADRYRMKGVFVPAGSVLTYSLPLGSGPRGDILVDGSLGSVGEKPLTLTIRSGKDRFVSQTKGPEITSFKSAFTAAESGRLDVTLEVDGPPGAVAVVGNLSFRRPFPKERRKNIFLHLVDALRADMGGAEGELFQSHFADGTVFTSAYANATFTAYSIPALFTGRYTFTLIGKNGQLPHLSEKHLLLAEYLKSKGYTTAAFINNPWLDHTRSSQGFDFVFHCWSPSREKASPFPSREFYAAAKYGEMEKLLRRFARENADKPVFIYIHTMEPHIPYEVPLPDRNYSAGADRRICEELFQKVTQSPVYPSLPDPTTTQLSVLKAQYKDDVRMAVAFFERVNRDLEEHGILDSSSLRILTGDHGERFFEHRSWIHGPPDMYQEVLRVPLMIRGAGFPPGTCEARVQLIDLFPTIVDWLGDSPPENLPGVPLREILARKGGPAADDRIIYADGQGAFPHFAFLEGGIKVCIKDGKIEVYDLEKDPGETVNLVKSPRAREAVKRARAFRRNLKTQPADTPARLSGQERERLKSLGYIR